MCVYIYIYTYMCLYVSLCVSMCLYVSLCVSMCLYSLGWLFSGSLADTLT